MRPRASRHSTGTATSNGHAGETHLLSRRCGTVDLAAEIEELRKLRQALGEVLHSVDRSIGP